MSRMTYLTRSNFQDHPFHLVSPSPWPLYTSICLLNLTTSAALSMHNFSNSYYFFYIALLLVVSAMSFWFRDIISEATIYIGIYANKEYLYTLATARAITDKDVSQSLNYFKLNSELAPSYKIYENNSDNFGHYLAGLLEGDGHISIPGRSAPLEDSSGLPKGALFKNSKSIRVFNPRVVFTSHINNLGLYAFIQSELGNIGRFQITAGNTLRYVIGDLKGIQLLINLMHGKFRTPKNQTFNNLIKIMNAKCSLNIPESLLDDSGFGDNSWLTGFTDSDGHFGIKYVEGKPKTGGFHLKRARSEHVTLKYRLDQRAYDKPTSLSMLPFMEKLAIFLDCPVKHYVNNTQSEILSLTVSAIGKLEPLVNYFDKYPVIGEKLNNYMKWRIVYDMIIAKEHLTPEGRFKIKSLIA